MSPEEVPAISAVLDFQEGGRVLWAVDQAAVEHGEKKAKEDFASRYPNGLKPGGYTLLPHPK